MRSAVTEDVRLFGRKRSELLWKAPQYTVHLQVRVCDGDDDSRFVLSQHLPKFLYAVTPEIQLSPTPKVRQSATSSRHTFLKFLFKLAADIGASLQRESERREVYIRSCTDRAGELPQNSTQEVNFLKEIADVLGMVFDTPERFTKRVASLEGEGSQPQQSGSHTYRFCHRVIYLMQRYEAARSGERLGLLDDAPWGFALRLIYMYGATP